MIRDTWCAYSNLYEWKRGWELGRVKSKLTPIVKVLSLNCIQWLHSSHYI